MLRFADHAERLAKRLFPTYRPNLKRGFTSFRRYAVTARKTSWRKDDTRPHVHSFPSNPTSGARLLRTFTNVNPNAGPGVWRAGEPFEILARLCPPRVKGYYSGAAWLMNKTRITKSLRTEYGHIMLQPHDLGKADRAYQLSSPQQWSFGFPPGSTWVVHSDQVQHAVSSGQFLLAQTFYLDANDLAHAERAPVRVLKRLAGRRLV